MLFRSPGEIGYPWYVDGYGYNHFKITFIDKYSDTDNIKVKGIDIYQTSLNPNSPDVSESEKVNFLSNPLIYKPEENIITTGPINTRSVFHDYDKPLHDTVEDIELVLATHETEIGSVEQDISSLNERIAELEAQQRIVILNQSKFITVNTTNFPRITGINGELTNWYEGDFSKAEWGSVPTNAIPLVWAYGSNGANSSTYLYMTSYGEAVVNNPALNAAEQSLGYDHGHEFEPSHVAWSGLLIPYQNLGESTPYKLAFRWSGTWYIKVQGYLLPRVPTIY